MLAVMAARTRIDSRPSRKTNTPISMTRTTVPLLDSVGLGLPPPMMTAVTMSASARTIATAQTIRWLLRAGSGSDGEVLDAISRKMQAAVRPHQSGKLREGCRPDSALLRIRRDQHFPPVTIQQTCIPD